jgi:hypothetical protein
MEYKGIVEAWEEYKSQIREPFADLRQLERVFMEGYRAGFSAEKDKKEVSRIEIINHTQTDKEIGRIFTYHGDVELSFQDGGKTLKIFI